MQNSDSALVPQIQVVVNSDEYAQLGAKSADLVAEGLRLSAVISNDLRRRCGHVRSSLNQLKRKINAGNETLRDAFNQMEQYDRSKYQLKRFYSFDQFLIDLWLSN